MTAELDALKASIARLTAATDRLVVDKSDAAFLEWHLAVGEVKRLHDKRHAPRPRKSRP